MPTINEIYQKYFWALIIVAILICLIVLFMLFSKKRSTGFDWSFLLCLAIGALGGVIVQILFDKKRSEGHNIDELIKNPGKWLNLSEIDLQNDAIKAALNDITNYAKDLLFTEKSIGKVEEKLQNIGTSIEINNKVVQELNNNDTKYIDELAKVQRELATALEEKSQLYGQLKIDATKYNKEKYDLIKDYEQEIRQLKQKHDEAQKETIKIYGNKQKELTDHFTNIVSEKMNNNQNSNNSSHFGNDIINDLKQQINDNEATIYEKGIRIDDLLAKLDKKKELINTLRKQNNNTNLQTASSSSQPTEEQIQYLSNKNNKQKQKLKNLKNQLVSLENRLAELQNKETQTKLTETQSFNVGNISNPPVNNDTTLNIFAPPPPPPPPPPSLPTTPIASSSSVTLNIGPSSSGKVVKPSSSDLKKQAQNLKATPTGEQNVVTKTNSIQSTLSAALNNIRQATQDKSEDEEDDDAQQEWDDDKKNNN